MVDSTFGTDGFTITDIDLEDNLCCLSILPDHKILLGGTIGDGVFQPVILRFSKDGILDDSFGEGGISFIELPSSYHLQDIGFQSDGKIIFTAGKASNCNVNDSCAVVGRLNTNGIMDNTFGNVGFFPLPLFREQNSVAIQEDDKIIVGGQQQGIRLIRLLPDGAPDSTFGNGGIVNSLPPEICTGLLHLADLEIQPDGKILALGFGGGSMECWPFFDIRRFDPDGAPDLSFGNSFGLHHFNCPDGVCYLNRIRITPEGKIIIMGIKDKIFLYRLLASGDLDEDFSTDGLVQIYSYLIGPRIGDALVLPDGSMVASTGGGYAEISLGKYDKDGLQEYDFGMNGTFLLPDTLTISHSKMELQEDKIIIASPSWEPGFNQNFGLTRIAFPPIPSNFAEKANDILQVQLFPNPTSGMVSVSMPFSARAGDVSLEVFDAFSRLALSEKLISRELNLSTLPAGVYWCLLRQEGMIISTGRMIKT